MTNREKAEKIADSLKLIIGQQAPGESAKEKLIADIVSALERTRVLALEEADGVASDMGVELLKAGDTHGWSVLDDFGHKLRELAGVV